MLGGGVGGIGGSVVGVVVGVVGVGVFVYGGDSRDADGGGDG